VTCDRSANFKPYNFTNFTTNETQAPRLKPERHATTPLYFTEIININTSTFNWKMLTALNTAETGECLPARSPTRRFAPMTTQQATGS
jgi:hypothetical protein